MRNFLLAASVVTIMASCTHPFSTDAAYNGLAHTQNYATNADTIIVGVEKRRRESVAPVPAVHGTWLRLATPGDRPGISPDELRKQNANAQRYFRDSKELVVTHIARSKDGAIIEYPYNLYKDQPNPNTQGAYVAGLDSLKLLQPLVKRSLSDARHTHVFVIAMGWANDQEESVMRIRMLTDNIVNAARANGDKRFNPLVVGITWPSQWFARADSNWRRNGGHLGSYYNKARDADTVGLLIGNKVVNEHLGAVVPGDMPIVLLGHSFGARLISRTAYSSDLLIPGGARRADLLISLQPAYSLRRFVPGDSNEGAPYVVSSPIRHFITASGEDNANPMAFWSRHGGGGKAIEYATVLDANSIPKRFTLVKWDKGLGKLDGPPFDRRVPTLIDAGDIVKENSTDAIGNTVSGHNDVFDQDMGDLVYYLIRANTRPAR